MNRGRKQTVDLPTYSSLTQCVGATGIPMGVLRTAKSQGCPAFPGNRLVLGTFLKWFFASRKEAPAEAKEQLPLLSDEELAAPVNGTWTESKARVATLREITKLKADRGELLARTDVQHAISKGMADVFAGLDRIFCSELPARGKGMDEIGLKKLAVEEIERLKENLKEQWGKV